MFPEPRGGAGVTSFSGPTDHTGQNGSRATTGVFCHLLMLHFKHVNYILKPIINSWSVAGITICVNCDITFLWKWLTFDAPQKQNPLTDYDKTLHSWLIPLNEYAFQKLYKSVVSVWANTWIIRPCLFLVLIFFADSLTEVTSVWFLAQNGSQHAEAHKDVPFVGQQDGKPHLWVQLPKNTKKADLRMAS